MKNLSEFSLFSESLVNMSPAAPSTPSLAPREEPAMAEKLKALKEAMGNDFQKHLEDYKEGVLTFLSKHNGKYEKGQWKQWNANLLREMGYAHVSQDDAKGVIRALQVYLRRNNKSVIVDGQFGPGLRQALRSYYQGLEDNEGYVFGKTKETFQNNEDNIIYYLDFNGNWVNQDHNPVDLKKLLPELAEGGAVNERGYFKIYNSDKSVTYYVDRAGNTFKNVMPGYDGPSDWVPVGQPGDIYAEVQGEDPRKNAQEFLINAKRGAGVERYYRYPNGAFTDEQGNIVNAKDVITRGTYETVIVDRGGGREEMYRINAVDGKMAYYDKEGNSVDLDRIKTSTQRYPIGDTELVYYRYKDQSGETIGSFSDKNGKTVNIKDVLPKIGEPVPVDLDESAEMPQICYELDVHGRRVRCDVNGKIINVPEVDPKKVPIHELKPEQIRDYLVAEQCKSVQIVSDNIFRFNLRDAYPSHLQIEMQIESDSKINLKLIDKSGKVVSEGPAIGPEQAFTKGHTRYLAEDMPHVIGRILDWAKAHTVKIDAERRERGIEIDKMNDSAIQKYMKEAGFDNVVTKEVSSGIIQHHFKYRGMQCAIHIVSERFFRFSADKPTHQIWHSPTPEAFSGNRNKTFTEKDMPRIMQMIKRHLDAHIEGKKA